MLQDDVNPPEIGDGQPIRFFHAALTIPFERVIVGRLTETARRTRHARSIAAHKLK
jgi:hypothetical protein